MVLQIAFVSGGKFECQGQHFHTERLRLQRSAEGLARLLWGRPAAAEEDTRSVIIPPSF